MFWHRKRFEWQWFLSLNHQQACADVGVAKVPNEVDEVSLSNASVLSSNEDASLRCHLQFIVQSRLVLFSQIRGSNFKS